MRHMFIKVGMASSFSDDGREVAVTVLKACTSKVLRHEVPATPKSTYGAVVVVEYDRGFSKKPVRGWKVSKEDLAKFQVGSSLSCEVKPGDLVKVSGVSKGKGFQDAMTRHGFAGGPASHGSRFHRAPGSVGARTEPGRTPKGKRLPGRMGCDSVSLINVRVNTWDADAGILSVVGGTPGGSGSVVMVGDLK